ncbi:MAG: type IV pilus twitching motility protein PilT [Fibrobacteria bacterium]|nr:type IV pilus twitching motility protein PilT [Fibrobacteria bacterium]
MAEEYTIIELFTDMLERGATDLLLSVGKPPQVRLDKELVSLDFDPLSDSKTRELCYEIMNEKQQKKLEDEWEVDFSFGLKKLARFRANVFMQRGAVSGSFRRIPVDILSFEELGLPPIAEELSERPNGLVLVTGPTGCGKSTTLAAMIDKINSTKRLHIITMEDPVEYLHAHKMATVDQREIETDTKSFANALKSVLRQDPDVVLLGEMRDPESIQAALTIAETGHLCFATLHTNSCAQTLTRIIDVFPGNKQDQIRTQLAMTLNGVLTQVLMPKIGGGLQLGLEVMVGTTAIKSIIREGKLHNIDNQIQLGSTHGMQTMNQSLSNLVKSGLVTEEDALSVSQDKEDFRKCMM